VPTLVSLFEVSPADDEAFVAGWTRTRDFLDERLGGVPTALHRSLSPAADFRWVDVAGIADPERWRAAIMDAGFPGRGMPGEAHASLYAVDREDPMPEGAEADAVLINPFDVPPGEDAAFTEAWERAATLLRRHPGFHASRLYRSVTDEADFRWVNVARWETAAAFGAAAQDPEFQAAARAMPHRGHPMLYEVISR
jgi:heme-degrading monooxygenase HmoA